MEEALALVDRNEVEVGSGSGSQRDEHVTIRCTIGVTEDYVGQIKIEQYSGIGQRWDHV